MYTLKNVMLNCVNNEKKKIEMNINIKKNLYGEINMNKNFY